MLWTIELNETQEVVVDYFGMEIESNYWDNYLDNKLDADDDVRIYTEVKRLWEEHAHSLQNLKELEEKGVTSGLDYVNYLFQQKGLKMV